MAESKQHDDLMRTASPATWLRRAPLVFIRWVTAPRGARQFADWRPS